MIMMIRMRYCGGRPSRFVGQGMRTEDKDRMKHAASEINRCGSGFYYYLVHLTRRTCVCLHAWCSNRGEWKMMMMVMLPARL